MCIKWDNSLPAAPPPVSNVPLQSNNPSVSVGGSGGNSVPFFSCDPDSLVVGVTVRNGNSLDGISSIFCNSTANIINGVAPTEKKVGWGGGGGNSNNFLCPSGAAMTGYYVGQGGIIDSISFQCNDIKNNADKGVSQKFGNATFNQQRTCDKGQFIGGLGGNAGSMMDSIKGSCRSLSTLQDSFQNPGTQLSCCSGETIDPLQCSILYPGSNYCTTKTKPLTCSNRNFFSTTGCKQLLGGDDKKIKNQIDEDLVEKICAQIKADPNATTEEKNLCSCINAEVYKVKKLNYSRN